MEKCMNGNIPIYAFDIIGENNIINNELEQEYRVASNQKRLTCCGCGAPIIFKFRNLDKMKPHFSHYSSSGNEGCRYGKETEEHREGKKLLLDHMRKSYPNAFHEMRYFVKSINRYADLYFKSDDKELIIEFQRTDLDINTINEKFPDYKSLDINILWILSEDYDPLTNVLRENSLSFSKRSILNDFNNKLTLLSVNNKEITLLSKMVYQDKKTQRVVMDEIFYRTYSLDDIEINLNGSITSPFEEELELAKSNFITKYEAGLKIATELEQAREKLRSESRAREKLRIENRSKENRRIFDEAKEKSTLNSYTEKELYISWDSITDKSMVQTIKPFKKSGLYNSHKNIVNTILKGESPDFEKSICEGFKDNLFYVDEIIYILDIKIKAGDKDAKLLLEKFKSHR